MWVPGDFDLNKDNQTHILTGGPRKWQLKAVRNKTYVCKACGYAEFYFSR